MNKSRESVLSWLLGLNVFFLPFVTSRHLFFGAVNSKTFYILFFVSVFVIFLSLRSVLKKENFSIRLNPLLLSSALCLALYYVSTLLGVYWERSLWSDLTRSTGLIFLSSVFVFSWILSNVLDAGGWRRIRYAFIFSGSIFSLLTLLGVGGLGFNERFIFNFAVPGLTIANTTFAGAFLLITFLLGFFEFFETFLPPRKKQLLFGALIAHLLSPLFVSWSSVFSGRFISDPFSVIGDARASAITLLIVLTYIVVSQIIHFIFRNRPSVGISAKKIWVGLVCVGISLLVISLFIDGTPVRDYYISQASEARPIVWGAGWEAFKQKPLLGWGPENFRFAFEKNFDNRLYLDENLGEIWFDRAHNLIIDTLVSVGVVGSLATTLVLFCFFWVVWRAEKRQLINLNQAGVLSVLVFAHILQLQTSFDVAVTYFPLVFVLGYGFWLEGQVFSAGPRVSQITERTLPMLFVLFFSYVLVYGVFVEWNRQSSLFQVFVTTNGQKQGVLIREALTRTSDFESLRLSSSSMIKGLLASLSSVSSRPSVDLISSAKEQLSIYDRFYLRYISQAPFDYRARINYANLLHARTILGDNALDEASRQIAESYTLSDNTPLSQSLESLNLLYDGKLVAAGEKISEIQEDYPRINFVTKIASHVEKQKITFPTISVLPLGNI